MRPLLLPLIRTVSIAVDPVISVIRRQPLTRRTLLRPRFRVTVVAIVGAALLARFAWELRPYVLDELPLAALALWLTLVASIAYLASRRYDQATGPGQHQTGR
jgi:hypothetical protein